MEKFIYIITNTRYLNIKFILKKKRFSFLLKLSANKTCPDPFKIFFLQYHNLWVHIETLLAKRCIQ